MELKMQNFLEDNLEFKNQYLSKILVRLKELQMDKEKFL
jgi:hypothetical protein